MTTSPATGWEVLDTALQGLATVADALRDGDLALPTPCEQWNVAQLLEHATGDQGAWAAAVGGGPGPAENPFTPSGILAAAPSALVAEAIRLANGAWQAVRPTDGAVPTPLPVGTLPAEPGDDQVAALLKYLGRRPDWKAAN